MRKILLGLLFFNPVFTWATGNIIIQASGASSGGVTSISTTSTGGTPITGAAQLLPGSNVTLTQSGQGITIASSGSGSGVSVYPATATASFPFGLTATTGTFSSLTSGQCVQAGTGGLLTASGSACGSGTGGSSTTTVQLGGVNLSTSTTNFNFISGTGFNFTGSTPSANNVSITGSADTAVILSRATDQAGTDRFCHSSVASQTLACAMNPTLTQYTTGQCFTVISDSNNVASAATTLNIDTLGAVSILRPNGVALSTGDITAGNPFSVCVSSGSSRNFIMQGRPGPDVASSSGGSSFADFVSTGSIVTNNNSNQTLWSYAAPALPAGSCYSMRLYINPNELNNEHDYIYVDATLIATPMSNFTGYNYLADIEYCNTTGSQATQTLSYTRYFYSGGSYPNTPANPNTLSGDNATNTPTAVNWSTGHTITVQTNALSRNTTGQYLIINAH